MFVMVDGGFPWSIAGATGLGSLPGVDARESARVVTGELSEFIHVVELPERGPGSDIIGRTAAMLCSVSMDFGLDTTPQGWRVAPGPGRAMWRAQSWLGEDYDALEEHALGYSGPVKMQLAGPWTLAASIEMSTGERLLKDQGACRDLAEALAEAVRLQIADLRRRFSGPIVVQVDEPALPAVLEGSIGTASGLSSYSPVSPQSAGGSLGILFDAIRETGAIGGVHCCGSKPPVPMLMKSGAGFVSIDLINGHVPDDHLGDLLESGVGLLAGSIESLGLGSISDERASRPVRELVHRLGMSDPAMLAGVVITPTCGMAGASPDWVRTAYASCRAAGRVLRDDRTLEEREYDEREGLNRDR